MYVLILSGQSWGIFTPLQIHLMQHSQCHNSWKYECIMLISTDQTHQSLFPERIISCGSGRPTPSCPWVCSWSSWPCIPPPPDHTSLQNMQMLFLSWYLLCCLHWTVHSLLLISEMLWEHLLVTYLLWFLKWMVTQSYSIFHDTILTFFKPSKHEY